MGQCVLTGVSTLNKVPCKFPFYYERNLYTECTTAGVGEKWCPTQTVETYYNGSWGACPGELFGEKIKLFLFIIPLYHHVVTKYLFVLGFFQFLPIVLKLLKQLVKLMNGITVTRGKMSLPMGVILRLQITG